MTTCTKCSRRLPPAGFYARPARPGGLHPWCKDCCRSSIRARYWADREHVRERHAKNYADNRAAVMARTAARERCRRAWTLHNATRGGTVVPEPCLFCESPDTHAHHHDYTQPLAVTWLCSRHHGLVHRAPPVA